MAHMITSTCDRCKKTETKEWKGTLDHCAESFEKYHTSKLSMLLCAECKSVIEHREEVISKNRQIALSEACKNVNSEYDELKDDLFSFMDKTKESE